MNTCKATLRVLFSHRAYLLIYLVFVGIMMLSISWSMLSGTSDSAAAAFEPAKMRVAVIDRDSDRGGIASSMRTYLSDSSELVNVDDASETLQQAVASNWVDLIVIIPDGFADDFIDAAATGENPPSVDTVTSYTSGAGSMARMNVIGFLSLTRTALIGSHTTVDSAALAAMAGIDIGDTAGDSSEDGMGGFGEFSNQDMLDMLPAGQIEKPSVGDLFEASKAAAASASDMDANHKVAVIDTASADAESASDMAASGFGNTMKTALHPLFLAMTVCGSMILGTFTTGEVRRRLTASPQRMSSMGLQRLLTLGGFALVVCVLIMFTSGVALPVDMMPGAMVTIAKFLPGWWYCRAIDNALGFGTAAENGVSIAGWIGSLGLVALFGVAFICIGLAAGRFRRSRPALAAPATTQLAE